ncbi:MAG: hypothetical protein ACKVOH_04345 [Chlamydiales bacterium]
MKPFILLIPFIAILGCTANAIPQEKKQVEHLYVLHAREGKISSTNTGGGEITLFEVDPSVVFFTDPPAAKAGTLPLTRFVQAWETRKKFDFSPPKASFVHIGEKEKHSFSKMQDLSFTEVPLNLSNPRYNATEKTLRFTINDFKPEMETKKLQEVTLFLDSGKVDDE